MKWKPKKKSQWKHRKETETVWDKEFGFLKVEKTKAPKEDFLGTLRAKATKEAREFAQRLIPVRTVTKEGLVFKYWPDGSVTVESVYDTIMQMVHEIEEFRAGKGRGF